MNERYVKTLDKDIRAMKTSKKSEIASADQADLSNSSLTLRIKLILLTATQNKIILLVTVQIHSLKTCKDKTFLRLSSQSTKRAALGSKNLNPLNLNLKEDTQSEALIIKRFFPLKYDQHCSEYQPGGKGKGRVLLGPYALTEPLNLD